MKIALFLVLSVVLTIVHCRKAVVPIDKNANVAFINMEGGGGMRPGSTTLAQGTAHSPTQPKPVPVPAQPTPAKPPQVAPTPAPVKPAPSQPPVKPAQAVPNPAVVQPTPAKPQQPHQIKPVPVNPAPAKNPITTPGPGSVKQLINFYDSQGKASPIRPYSYSSAVKQG